MPRPKSPAGPRTRTLRALTGAAAVGAALSLSGCYYLSDQTTELHYDASDGVSGQVGKVQVANLLVVGSAQGSKGELHGMASNSSEDPQTLTVKVGGTTAQVKVPAQGAVRLDGKQSGDSTATTKAVTIPKLPEAPGTQIPVVISNGGSSTSVQTPIELDQEPYGTADPKDEGGETSEGGHH